MGADDRAQFVRQRTALINLLRSELRQEGLRLRACAAESVPRQFAALPVSRDVADALAPLVEQLETLTARIVACTRGLETKAAADPVVVRLQTTPGWGLSQP